MIDEVFESMTEGAASAIESLRIRLGRIRTGRANAALLDSIRVDYYGTMTPLNQMASINTPEPRLIMVKPWDRSVVAAVEKAIQSSDLGLNPASDGEIIRIPVPPLTEERRKELVKMARKYGEECKVSVRNARRDSNELLKELESSGDAPKDDVARALKKIQEMTDAAVADVDKVVAAKEEDITEV
ncbi:MAG: ribosome recycling factor [Deltaproteobacteria bacterium]|jgi:ribosome recycling factor|nr:ribosome recycling factor [Deltaproteobacteria bacterium]